MRNFKLTRSGWYRPDNSRDIAGIPELRGGARNKGVALPLLRVKQKTGTQVCLPVPHCNLQESARIHEFIRHPNIMIFFLQLWFCAPACLQQIEDLYSTFDMFGNTRNAVVFASLEIRCLQFTRLYKAQSLIGRLSVKCFTLAIVLYAVHSCTW